MSDASLTPTANRRPTRPDPPRRRPSPPPVMVEVKAPPLTPPELTLGGIDVDLFDRAGVDTHVRALLMGATARPLAVISANVDHVYRFGDTDLESHRFVIPGIDTLTIIDGMPLAWLATVLKGDRVERITGVDLLADFYAAAEACDARLGFLGGSPETLRPLRRRLRAAYPTLDLRLWSPSAEDLASPQNCRDIAQAISDAEVDVLVISLGKPRQEQWLATYGLATGAKVFLCSGGAIDFHAGTTHRAPEFVQQFGLEWLFRLVSEPKRLWRRYLLQGPIGVHRLLTKSANKRHQPDQT